eukprot:6623205-Pyramimonas_sp.AAC.2
MATFERNSSVLQRCVNTIEFVLYIREETALPIRSQSLEDVTSRFYLGLRVLSMPMPLMCSMAGVFNSSSVKEEIKQVEERIKKPGSEDPPKSS